MPGCRSELDAFVDRLVTPANPIPPGRIDLNLKDLPTAPWQGNFTQPDFEAAVGRCVEYIGAGDAFKAAYLGISLQKNPPAT